MPLSDSFKKSPKPEPEKLKKGRDAATEFIPVLQAKLASPDGRVHAGTILSAAAWLTGTSLYRAFHPKDDIPPGTTIQSNEMNKEWESLMYLFEEYNFGDVRVPVGRLIMSALAAPDEHKPLVEMFYVQKELQDQYNAVMKKHGFDYLDGARAGVLICSLLFYHHCTVAKDINPSVAAGFVAQGILEAAKTAPPPLRSAT
jgi:hypothetical protein